MILFFDTETTGTPKDYKASAFDLNNWPRVIQLGFQLYDNEGVLQSEYLQLIKPEGWVIPNEKFWIDNGFSTEKSEAEGVPILDALNAFVECINKADLMVAHNLNFDYPILAAEMIRTQIKAERRPEKFCTMLATVDLCQLPGKYGFKWPKLEELHKFLFGETFDGAHDALADVSATARCYFHLRDKVWNKPTNE